MPTKKTSTDLKSSKKAVSKKSDSKKVVVKKRTAELMPTKASAVAIVSRAQRAKNSSFSTKTISDEGSKSKKTTKIPLWVWIFFGCALLLFSVAFYKAIINPQLDVVVVDRLETDSNKELQWESVVIDLNDKSDIIEIINENLSDGDCIVTFFDKLSNQDFIWAFELLDSPLQKSSEIKDHFTSFRMSPFLAWIQWEKLEPKNIRYVWQTAAWNDEYRFDLSYVLKSDTSQYEEEWKVVLKNQNWKVKIASLICETKKCSYHPLFWPENYDLMR